MGNEEKKTVLIVDDMELNRKMLGSIIGEKYDIIEASNGKRAWDIMKRDGKKISLILLDIVMPVMDGMSFLKFIQMDDRLKDIPIIFVTSETYEENIHEGVRLGVQDVIAKPFDPYTVSSRVDNLIRLTETRKSRANAKQNVKAPEIIAKPALPTPRTALIVDDIGINREILKNALKDQYDILEAEDGREALKMIELHKNEIAVVLLDIIMPVMDGIELMKEVKRKKLLTKTPIIAITGEDSMPKLTRIKELGICEVIRKPFNPTIVSNRVQYMIELYRGF